VCLLIGSLTSSNDKEPQRVCRAAQHGANSEHSDSEQIHQTTSIDIGKSTIKDLHAIILRDTREHIER